MVSTVWSLGTVDLRWSFRLWLGHHRTIVLGDIGTMIHVRFISCILVSIITIITVVTIITSILFTIITVHRISTIIVHIATMLVINRCLTVHIIVRNMAINIR